MPFIIWALGPYRDAGDKELWVPGSAPSVGRDTSKPLGRAWSNAVTRGVYEASKPYWRRCGNMARKPVLASAGGEPWLGQGLYSRPGGARASRHVRACRRLGQPAQCMRSVPRPASLDW